MGATNKGSINNICLHRNENAFINVLIRSTTTLMAKVTSLQFRPTLKCKKVSLSRSVLMAAGSLYLFFKKLDNGSACAEQLNNATARKESCSLIMSQWL